MTTKSVIPKTCDVNFIRSKLMSAGIQNHFGLEVKEEGLVIVYRADDFDAVQAVLDAYPVSYLNEVERPKLLNDIKELRREKQSQMPYQGGFISSDLTTISQLTAAVVLMDVIPDGPQERRWKMGEGVDGWVTLSRNDLVGLGALMAEHIQACFNKEESLVSLVEAAQTINDTALIDIESGWPQ
jgi:hypothetical protein